MKHLVFGRTRSSHIQFLRYFFVGGSAAVVDLIVYTLLFAYLGVRYPIAALFAYACGLAWNYVISLVWIFESRHARTYEILMVIGIAIGGLLWTWLILFLCIDLFGMDGVLAKMISQLIVLAWNFGMRKVYVFR